MLTIDTVTHDDIERTSELHHSHLRLGFFPKLGRTFLRHYQQTFAESPFGVALVARNGSDVVGALFGTTSNVEHYRWVMHNRGAELAALGSMAMMTRPMLAYSFATTRLGRYVRGVRRHLTPGAAVEAAPLEHDARPQGSLAVLSHIVTDTAQRRSGIGRGLVEEFRYRARSRGAGRALLVTEQGGMGDGFFARIGCERIAARAGADGAQVHEYRLELEDRFSDGLDELAATLGARAVYSASAAPAGHERAAASALVH